MHYHTINARDEFFIFLNYNNNNNNRPFDFQCAVASQCLDRCEGLNIGRIFAQLWREGGAWNCRTELYALHWLSR